MHVVVLSFDRLHLGYLGCYGNDWIETPHLDRFAFESVVFDQHFGENFDLGAAHHAWWTGRELSPLGHEAQRRVPEVLARLRQAGVQTHLFVEGEDGPDSTIAPDFDDVQIVRGRSDKNAKEAQFPFAQLVKRAAPLLQTLDEQTQPVLIWLKSRGVAAPWIPPSEFADLYFEEFGLVEESPDDDAREQNDDREESEDLEHAREVDGREAPVADDAGIDLRWARALYAAYVTYLDRWVGKFLSLLAQHVTREEITVIVTAAAGESLGEHGGIGPEHQSLYEELIHAPLLIRLPGSDQAGSRRSALVQTIDLAPTVCELLGAAIPAADVDGRSLLPIIRNESEAIRDAVFLGEGGREQGVRTPDSYFVRHTSAKQADLLESAELYQKPYDRWDMADLIRQRHEQAEALNARLNEHLQAICNRQT